MGMDQPPVARPGLILMCGPSFSGKSVLARALAPLLGAELVSLDSINEARGLFGGKGVPVDEWMRTHELAAEQTRQWLTRGKSVIVDDTSSPRFLRDAWRGRADQIGCPFALVFVDTPPDVISRRHEANRSTRHRHDVTDDILREHLRGFEPPEPDEAAIRVSDPAEPTQVALEVRWTLTH
jgi:predicted kinase